MLELYEFEGCPYCRLVREALTDLDLDAKIYPCPKNGTRFRPEAIKRSGTISFPFLSDPNTGVEMIESADIIDYLNKTYGDNRYKVDALDKVTRIPASILASAIRGGKGIRVRDAKPAEKLLELYGFESSPYARLVREVLCELELPYILRNLGKASKSQMGPPIMRKLFFANKPITGRNRKKLFDLTGEMQSPYLYDPNTQQGLYESAKINRYLLAQYAL